MGGRGDRVVIGVLEPKFPHVERIMAGVPQLFRNPMGDIGVDEEAHESGKQRQFMLLDGRSGELEGRQYVLLDLSQPPSVAVGTEATGPNAESGLEDGPPPVWCRLALLRDSMLLTLSPLRKPSESAVKAVAVRSPG
jgi:hypothetical protein